MTLADPLDPTPPLLLDLVQALVFLVFTSSAVFLFLFNRSWTCFLYKEAFTLCFLLLVTLDRLVVLVAAGDFEYLLVVRETGALPLA